MDSWFLDHGKCNLLPAIVERMVELNLDFIAPNKKSLLELRKVISPEYKRKKYMSVEGWYINGLERRTVAFLEDEKTQNQVLHELKELDLKDEYAELNWCILKDRINTVLERIAGPTSAVKVLRLASNPNNIWVSQYYMSLAKKQLEVCSFPDEEEDSRRFSTTTYFLS